jgi:hypothetical protein
MTPEEAIKKIALEQATTRASLAIFWHTCAKLGIIDIE